MRRFLEVGLEAVLLVAGVIAVILLQSRKRYRQRFTRRRRQQPPAVVRRNTTAHQPSRIANRNATPPVPQSPVRPPQEQVVFGLAYVTDGDGLRIKGQEIRLFGIDAPEFKHPYGRKAKSALLGLCKGQKVMAVSAETDSYGRLVARCFLSDGRDLSAEMVKLGLALDWPKFSGHSYAHLEPAEARKKLWLADARQRGRMDLWKKYEVSQRGAS